MLRTRVIPCLLLMDGRLVKTVQFKNPNYVGDPINIVKIFNSKEVDELIFLDINATPNQYPPNFKLIAEIASECFMPFGYGGGITSLSDVKKIFNLGAEKVVVNTIAVKDKTFIKRVSEQYGSQSVIASIDVKKHFFKGHKVCINGGRTMTSYGPIEYAIEMQKMGAGEILLTSINQDGKMQGYDLELIKAVSQAVDVPVIACGGAGEINDFVKAIEQGASAVAAGSMVVYQGKNRAVLTKFPSHEELAILP